MFAYFIYNTFLFPQAYKAVQGSNNFTHGKNYV